MNAFLREETQASIKDALRRASNQLRHASLKYDNGDLADARAELETVASIVASAKSLIQTEEHGGQGR